MMPPSCHHCPPTRSPRVCPLPVDKRTALHISAAEGNLQAVQLLVEQGKANPEGAAGWPPHPAGPLLSSRLACRPAVPLSAQIPAPMPPSAVRDRWGYTPLDEALRVSAGPVIRFLTSLGLEPSAAAADNGTSVPAASATAAAGSAPAPAAPLQTVAESLAPQAAQSNGSDGPASR